MINLHFRRLEAQGIWCRTHNQPVLCICSSLLSTTSPYKFKIMNISIKMQMTSGLASRQVCACVERTSMLTVKRFFHLRWEPGRSFLLQKYSIVAYHLTTDQASQLRIGFLQFQLSSLSTEELLRLMIDDADNLNCVVDACHCIRFSKNKLTKKAS